MNISGIGLYEPNFEVEENRSVEMVKASTSRNAYFQDRNPENTFAPFFNRALRAEQEKGMNLEKRRRDFRQTDDYKLLQAQNKSIIDTYR